jgi:hypothetical protein
MDSRTAGEIFGDRTSEVGGLADNSANVDMSARVLLLSIETLLETVTAV